ncbi:MAG: RNA 2',3'-cyclic phosphodiesterase, partial [Halobacteria archaeon]|nr:RNA 2',3'-cyclic phosphodiesterase [Halobacteria archaeon]
RRVSERHSAFEVEVRGAGVFPSRDHIDTVWVGVGEGTEELREIHDEVEEKVVSRGVAEPDEHDFVPHVTLGRLTSGRGKSEVRKFVDENSDKSVCSFEVSSVRLMKSESGKGAESEDEKSVYETVYTAELKREEGGRDETERRVGGKEDG